MKTLRFLFGILVLLSMTTFTKAQGWNYRENEKDFGYHSYPESRNGSEEPNEKWKGERNAGHYNKYDDYSYYKEKLWRIEMELKDLERKINRAERERKLSRKEEKTLKFEMGRLWKMKSDLEYTRHFEYRQIEYLENEISKLERDLYRMITPGYKW